LIHRLIANNVETPNNLNAGGQSKAAGAEFKFICRRYVLPLCRLSYRLGQLFESDLLIFKVKLFQRYW